MPRLLITNGVQQGRAFRLRTGVNRIGRSVDNHFQVPDPSVSSSHCELTLSAADVLVRDLSSTNGTYIDGEPVTEARICLHQLLQLGNVEMKLEEPPLLPEGTAVNIPEVAISENLTSVVLPDGSTACANHPEIRGAYHCTKCQQILCESCVRVVRRLGGDTLFFCSLCAAACERLTPASSASVAPQGQKQSFLDRLSQTLKLSFKR
jgi:Inner membrane component of T3SS, cytoplasmic domain